MRIKFNPDKIGTKFKIQNNGFTLIEILVAIAIVSVISAVVVPNLVNIRQKARDTKRKVDLREMKNALEQYYTVCGNQYPLPEADGSYGGIICYAGTGEINILPTTSLPQDPKTGGPYLCGGLNECDATKYTICTTNMETEANVYCVGSLQ